MKYMFQECSGIWLLLLLCIGCQVHPEGKYVVDLDKSIDINKITPSTRVALRNDSYVLHLILPSKVDPLVNLMKVEKVPDSTYDMIGGLDQQIKEIKEVRSSNSLKISTNCRMMMLTWCISTTSRWFHSVTLVSCWSGLLNLLQVIELPIKHPELFESLGIAQPKVPDLIFSSRVHP